MSEEKTRKCVIIGSGPAGWTAAIYLSRANLSPVVYCGQQIGGQLTTTTEIENFPGFAKGIDGPQLMQEMEDQAKNYGTEIIYDEIKSVDTSQKPFVLETSKGPIKAHSIIVCTGASPKMLGLESEKTFWNRGVHTCAVCDGGFYKGKVAAVVGGGDSAMEEATYLAKLLEKVYIVHRRDEFRASQIMQDRALATKNIEVVWNSEVVEIMGDTSGQFPVMQKLKIKNTQSGETSELKADAFFIAIGHTPNSAFLGDQFKTDENGYLEVNDRQETNVAGVWAAGDIHDHRYRQAITAAGFGCKAALEVERWLTHEGIVD